MEEFVRSLFTDADFRREFVANPMKVIANSGLSGHERDAAERLSPHLMLALSSPTGGRVVTESLVWSG